jgi:hypothetical protein
MTKAVVAVKEPIKQQEEQAAPTDNEVAIAKAEAKVEKMKHVDARTLALDYLFPLMRKLAGEAGDLSEALSDTIEEFNEKIDTLRPADDIVSVLEDARDMIVSMAGLLDQTMAAAGFCIVTKKGDQLVLSVTDKMPKELREAYEHIGPTATEVVTDIQDAIASAGEADDGEDAEDADEDDDDGEDDVDEVAEETAVVAPVAGTTTVVTPAPGVPTEVLPTTEVEVLTPSVGAFSSTVGVEVGVEVGAEAGVEVRGEKRGDGDAA